MDKPTVGIAGARSGICKQAAAPANSSSNPASEAIALTRIAASFERIANLLEGGEIHTQIRTCDTHFFHVGVYPIYKQGLDVRVTKEEL
jgi:hypothetical protein